MQLPTVSLTQLTAATTPTHPATLKTPRSSYNPTLSGEHSRGKRASNIQIATLLLASGPGASGNLLGKEEPSTEEETTRGGAPQTFGKLPARNPSESGGGRGRTMAERIDRISLLKRRTLKRSGGHPGDPPSPHSRGVALTDAVGAG